MGDPLVIDSILESVKSYLSIEPECTDFDKDLIPLINSYLWTAIQVGVSTQKVFSITGPEQTWADFLKSSDQSAVRLWLFIKVKLVFDPPINSTVIQAMKDEAKELEWRLNISEEEPQ